MKRTRIRRQPCVVLPPNSRREREEHVIHATEWRARRNAALTADVGYRFHVHETTVPTLWGLLIRFAHWMLAPPYWLVAAVAVLGLPLLLPITGTAAAFDAYARRVKWRADGPRHGTWFWRIWWFYGYHGLYQFDWAMKRRCAQ